MPFALIIIGLALLVSGARNTQDQLFTLVEQDTAVFIPWAAAILVIGALGYIEALRPLSRGFLVLLIVVIFLKGGQQGLFQKFQTAVDGTPKVTVQPIQIGSLAASH